jgi:chromosome segregation ATPase
LSAKKKRTKKKEIRVRKSAVAALTSLTMSDSRPVLDELDRLRRLLATTESDRMYVEQRLAEANELLKSGQETMRGHAGVVVELSEKIADLQWRLAAKEKELAIRERTITGFAGERDFLWEEIDRFRNRVMDYIRWQALLPEDARLALSKVTAQEFEDELDEDAEKS